MLWGCALGTLAWQTTCFKLAAGCVTLRITSQCLLQSVLGMLQDILRLTQHIRMAECFQTAPKHAAAGATHCVTECGYRLHTATTLYCALLVVDRHGSFSLCDLTTTLLHTQYITYEAVHQGIAGPNVSADCHSRRQQKVTPCQPVMWSAI